MQIPDQYIKNLYRALLTFLFLLCVYFAIQSLSLFRAYGHEGSQNVNTISFSGHGEVTAVPDIANISFTVESSKSTQSASSDEVNTKTKSVVDFLKSSGVADKDIKTQNYSSYPKYSNGEPCYYSTNSMGQVIPCRTTPATIIGYTVSQSVSVKVRKVDDVSKIIDGINKIGVSNMYGPSLAIDNEDGLKLSARKQAIDDAKSKAESLAKDLGVSLGRIASFSEGGNYGVPMYAMDKMSAGATASAPVPSTIPTGENTITSDVTITYEIR